MLVYIIRYTSGVNVGRRPRRYRRRRATDSSSLAYLRDLPIPGLVGRPMTAEKRQQVERTRKFIAKCRVCTIQHRKRWVPVVSPDPKLEKDLQAAFLCELGRSYREITLTVYGRQGKSQKKAALSNYSHRRINKLNLPPPDAICPGHQVAKERRAQRQDDKRTKVKSAPRIEGRLQESLQVAPEMGDVSLDRYLEAGVDIGFTLDEIIQGAIARKQFTSSNASPSKLRDPATERPPAP